MKEEKDYIRDIAEIRSIMERSSKFLSLSGWAGIMAGLYALAGVYLAYTFLDFNPNEIVYSISSAALREVIFIAVGILMLSAVTAVFLSYKKANTRGEKLWNPISKRLLSHMSVPFITGAILILILVEKDLIGLVPPFSLLFYGLALYNAGKFTYAEVRVLGLVEIGLALISTYFIEYGLLFWALGFGVAHIIYGIFMHYKYER